MQAKTLADLYSDWDKVQAHAQAWQKRTLKDAFDADRNRAARYSVGAAGLELDFSKNHIDDETLQLLMGVADQANLKAAIKKLLRGDHVNNTEDRPALHSALRFQGKPQTAEHQEVKATLDKMAKLIKSVHSGEWKGYKGEKITDVVNIGIGGSDLGPRMITKALTPFHTGDVKVHFVANIDGAEIHDLTRGLNPSTTLFLVASKSFSTLETLENSLTARKWMLDNGCAQDQLAKHFVDRKSVV